MTINMTCRNLLKYKDITQINEFCINNRNGNYNGYINKFGYTHVVYYK